MLNSSKQQCLLFHNFHGLESGYDLGFLVQFSDEAAFKRGVQFHLMALLGEGLLSHAYI